MKIASFAVAALLLACALPLHAQTRRDAPEPVCACASPNFKPLNDKARAVADYWAARRKYKIASNIAAAMALFSVATQDGGAMNNAQNTMSNAMAELAVALSKAMSLGGVKATGADVMAVEIILEKDADYTIAP